MTPRESVAAVEPLPLGALPPRAPRGFVAIRIRGTQHMARRGHPATLCGDRIGDRERIRPIGRLPDLRR